jgi:multidrug efflux pump subunit AcrA (membrane-fusion protein)
MGVRVAFLEDAPAPGGAPLPGLRIPAAAVQASGGTGVVFVVHDDTVERRAVRLGSGGGGSALVLSGLAAGDKVVVGDLGQMRDGATVRVAQGAS